MAENRSRLKNSKRNIISGLFRQIMTIVLTFAIRTVILYTLGVEYQGLGGLFTSILQVLNMTELGFSAAVTFSLYKPIAEGDTKSVCAILAYLKRVYRIIGMIILAAGVAIMPFLPLLIKGSYPSEINIYVLYGIFLANAVVSYLLFAYKSTLLTAMQRMDLVSNAFTVTNIFGKLLQVIVLITTRNYYLYVLLMLISTAANNLLVEYMSRRYYPKIRAYGLIEPEIKSNLLMQVRAVFINRIGDVARNSFDNIVLSAFVGLSAVAIYDNYYYIYMALYGMMGIIVNSVRASIGNSIVKESVNKNYDVFLKFSFMFMWISGFCTVCMFVLYQPFMNIWMRGKQELLLPLRDMALFCLYFYAMAMAYTKNIYLEAKGLFHESRYLYILEALCNLLLNIILCKSFGTTGILIATIVTILVFNFAGGTVVLYRHYFKRPIRQFALHHCLYFAVTIVACVLTYLICERLPLNGLVGFAVRACVCAVVPNVIYLCVYSRMPMFPAIISVVKRFIR